MGVDTLSDASMPVNMTCMQRLIAEFETCCAPLMEAPLASDDAEVSRPSSARWRIPRAFDWSRSWPPHRTASAAAATSRSPSACPSPR